MQHSFGFYRIGLRDQIEIDVRSLRLKTNPETPEPSLAFAAHFLAQHDGATFISREGTMITTGVHLAPSKAAQQFVNSFRGTRHTSARRASFDLADTLIVTVSADGPVTVFSDGANVFEWRYSAQREATAMRRAYGEMLQDSLSTDFDEKKCPRCGKTSVIEILIVSGHRGDENADCPVCGQTIASARCYEMHANVRKTF